MVLNLQTRGRGRLPGGASGLGILLMAGAVKAAECIDATALPDNLIGLEVGAKARLSAMPRDERTLLSVGRDLFLAVWTIQEGGGRPLTNGVGGELADPSRPLEFPRNFNRISAPDANACAGCHNLPVDGGGGDIVTNVFVTAQRFDAASFDNRDSERLVGARDERGRKSTLEGIGNFRATLGMSGSGYIELLAREMTEDLQALRDSIEAGGSVALETKGVSFGTLAREGDRWDVSAVEGLAEPSLSWSADTPPSLVVMPFHQAGAVVSLRQFTNNAFNHHHGIQTVERFGEGDVDGDGFCNEMSEAEVTAVSVWQAVLPPPGRVIPSDPKIEDAVLLGERLFNDTGCASCHMPALELESTRFLEPNPFNPPGNLSGEPVHSVDLQGSGLPGPRLPGAGRSVPAYTDLKLHDITSGPDDPNCEPIDQNASDRKDFLGGNCRFLTKKLWGAANEPPYFHHGKFATLREAIEAHDGDAAAERAAYDSLDACEQDAMIEFLRTLQTLPANAAASVIDEANRPKGPWPPADADRRAARACRGPDPVVAGG